ncbi:MAG: hypothetical protein PVF27_02620 [Gemmatimonadales bacterium]|jgi:hypothetical protein
MIWGVALTVLIVALLIPILVVVRDAPAFRRRDVRPELAVDDPAERIEQLTRRLQLLEDELDDLARTVDQVRDDTQFLQQLLENPDRDDRAPPGAGRPTR